MNFLPKWLALCMGMSVLLPDAVSDTSHYPPLILAEYVRNVEYDKKLLPASDLVRQTQPPKEENKTSPSQPSQNKKEKTEKASQVESCQWEVRPDMGTISSVLNTWAKQEGWQLLWEHSQDFPVPAYARFCGTLEQALDHLVRAIHQEESIKIRLYGGNRVIRVTSSAH